MLGLLLFAAFEFLFQGNVLGRRLAARPGAGDGVRVDDAVVDGGDGLDGCAHDLEPVEVQVVHVGRRVAAPQGAVHLERVGVGLATESLGVDHLDHVAGVDVLDALVDDGFIFGDGEIGLDLAAGRHGRLGQQFGRNFQRPGETVHHPLDLGDGCFVRGVDVAIIEAGVADDLDVVAQVVEHQ